MYVYLCMYITRYAYTWSYFSVSHAYTQIALGTVTNVEEAVQWLRYSYLYVRMLRNPLVYAIPHHHREVSQHVTTA